MKKVNVFVKYYRQLFKEEIVKNKEEFFVFMNYKSKLQQEIVKKIISNNEYKSYYWNKEGVRKYTSLHSKGDYLQMYWSDIYKVIQKKIIRSINNTYGSMIYYAPMFCSWEVWRRKKLYGMIYINNEAREYSNKKYWIDKQNVLYDMLIEFCGVNVDNVMFDEILKNNKDKR